MASFNESGQKFILTVKSGEGEKECEATYITRISDGEREFIYYFIQEDGDNVGIYASRIDLIDGKKVMRDITDDEERKYSTELFTKTYQGIIQDDNLDKLYSDDKYLKPYYGDEPYVFISYSHRYTEFTFELIRELQSKGLRVCFDKAIEVSKDWTTEIAKFVGGCSYIVLLISEEYLQSENCMDELMFAKKLNKKIVIICDRHKNLPTGLMMKTVGEIFIYKNDIDNYKTIAEKLLKAISIHNRVNEINKTTAASKSYIYLSYCLIDVKDGSEIKDDLSENEVPVFHEEYLDDKDLTDVRYNCDLFIAIISKAYLLSPNYDELMYANSIGKRCMLIYVSEIHDSMNEILRLRFNRTQSIFKYKYKDNDQFAKELIACPEIVRCMTLPFDPIE